MIKYIASLGVMSALGTPMMLRLLPKVLFGVVLRKVAKHYLDTGKHLQEALEDASEDAFLAILAGVQPSLLRNSIRSRVFRGFVKEFQTNYFHPFLELHSELAEKEFKKQVVLVCRQIVKELPSLVESISPSEEDVHLFFSEEKIETVGIWINEGEAQLFEQLQQIEGMNQEIFGLFRYKHLLFQAIHFFFRQRLVKSPAVKAIFDELNELKVVRTVEQAQVQQRVLQRQLSTNQHLLVVLSDQIKQMQNAEQRKILVQEKKQLLTETKMVEQELSFFTRELLSKAKERWEKFQNALQDFAHSVGHSLQLIEHELKDLRVALVDGIEHLDIHLSEQDQKINEIIWLLKKMLGGSSEEESHYSDLLLSSTLEGVESDWKPRFQRLALQQGLEDGLVHSLLDKTAFLKQNQEAKKIRKILIEVVSPKQSSRTFILYLSDKISVGRHSKNDLVLHWFPLPEPSDTSNPEWKNWKKSGRCHPFLEISGVHFELSWVNGSLLICDRSSKGTFLGAKRLPSNQTVRLQDGDVLSVAKVLKLSYSLLKDPEGKSVGWRMRRLDNSPSLEEYLFLQEDAMISIGASSNDGIAFSALGLQAQHVGLRRKQGQIELVPGNGELLLDGASIETPQSLLLGMRFVLGQQSVWFFPEEN